MTKNSFLSSQEATKFQAYTMFNAIKNIPSLILSIYVNCRRVDYDDKGERKE